VLAGEPGIREWRVELRPGRGGNDELSVAVAGDITRDRIGPISDALDATFGIAVAEVRVMDEVKLRDEIAETGVFADTR